MANLSQYDAPLRSSYVLQQQRFLSIHEYLSASLLKTVGGFPGVLATRLTVRSMASVYRMARSPAQLKKPRPLRKRSVRI